MQPTNRPRSSSFGMVSILYEADRLCNRPAPAWAPPGRTCFNPLRGRQTLQRESANVQVSMDLVSILYEADRLCNKNVLARFLPTFVVSILYEADRLCNDSAAT